MIKDSGLQYHQAKVLSMTGSTSVIHSSTLCWLQELGAYYKANRVHAQLLFVYKAQNILCKEKRSN